MNAVEPNDRDVCLHSFSKRADLIIELQRMCTAKSGGTEGSAGFNRRASPTVMEGSRLVAVNRNA